MTEGHSDGAGWQALLRQEVERVNVEWGTDIEAPEVMSGDMSPRKADIKVFVRTCLWGVLTGLPLAIAGLGLWIGLAIDASAGLRVVLIALGLVGLTLAFFTFRASWRAYREYWRRINTRNDAFNEVIRRLEMQAAQARPQTQTDADDYGAYDGSAARQVDPERRWNP